MGTKNTVSSSSYCNLTSSWSQDNPNTLVFQKDDKVYILSIEGDKETINDFWKHEGYMESRRKKFKCLKI